MQLDVTSTAISRNVFPFLKSTLYQKLRKYKVHKGAFNNYVDKKRGRGGLLNVHVDQNLAISESILYSCTLEWLVKKKRNKIMIIIV